MWYEVVEGGAPVIKPYGLYSRTVDLCVYHDVAYHMPTPTSVKHRLEPWGEIINRNNNN